ncbi:MAG: hypothetical protein ALECFALPRED_004257 [Alectoria fallacina]|uniref:Uncharacterized protein n=1 Tax=Alectoria fallacina TaxID=1903189 RepID=A0A8H3FR61_9LECA|nr:MAG: hypothetical protein ALECFALPRED_004257 [Alectoria fallacina]
MDEDEDYEPLEKVLPDWVLSQVDFGVIDFSDLARNYSNRDGKAEVKSDERTDQKQWELFILMAIYITLPDISSPPREPSEPFTEDRKLNGRQLGSADRADQDARSFHNLAIFTGVTSPGDHVWH